MISTLYSLNLLEKTMADKKEYCKVGTPVSEHFNSKNELAVIVKRPADAALAPNGLLLCLVDNKQSGSYVPMLLDKETVDWIVSVFGEHGKA